MFNQNSWVIPILDQDTPQPKVFDLSRHSGIADAKCLGNRPHLNDQMLGVLQD